MIKVNEEEIDFKNGMTVADALQTVGESIGAMTLVMIDWKVLSFDQFKSEELVDGTHIKLLTIISGG